MKRIRIWLKAHFTHSALWRVTYDSGRRTRLLCKNEAKELADMFGGSAWIDYSQYLK